MLVPGSRRPSFTASTVTGLFSLGWIALGGVAVAQGPPGTAAQQAAYPLSGYVLEVRGGSVRLSLTAEDGIQPGDELSVLQYGEEIARLRVKTVTPAESIAEVLLQKREVVLRRLDTVVPSTAVARPAQDLQPLAPTPPELELKPDPKRKPRSPSRRNPGDIVSRSDWTYPALSTLAKRDLLPNTPLRELHGENLYTREEIRGFVEEAVRNREQALAEETSLRVPAAPALPSMNGAPAADPAIAPPAEAAVVPAPAGVPPDTSNAPVSPSADPPAGTAPAKPAVSPAAAVPAPADNLRLAPSNEPEDRLLFHLARQYEIETSLPSPRPGLAVSRISRYRLATGDEETLLSSGTLQGLLHLGPERYGVLSLSQNRREWYGDNDYPWINEAYLNFKWSGVEWQVGQKALRWGPGYTGSLTLGDYTPSLPMIRGYRTWSLGRILGKLDVEQFISRFSEFGGARYFVGRRISRTFGRGFSVGLSETAKMASVPHPAALILPFQLYQRWFEDNTNTINIQATLDASYRARSHEFYGEFFIDDITAPSALGQGPVPRKVGYLAGWKWDRVLNRDDTSLRAEWAQTDRNTYLHRNPAISYYNRGFSLGHPMGPNTRSMLLRVDRRLNQRLDLMAAVQFLSQRTPAPPVSADDTAFTLAAAYDFQQDRSLIVKLSPNRRVDRYNVPARSTVEVILDWVF